MANTRSGTAGALLFAVLICMGAKGCFPETRDASDKSIDEVPELRDHYEPPQHNKAARGPTPEGHLIALKNTGTTTGYALVSSPFDLWAPFRWEVTAGRLAAGAAGAMTGFFCTELDARGSSPLEFYALCAQHSGDGFQVWVSRAGENFVGQVAIGPADALDLAVEHDGAGMTFWARARGTGEFQQVAAVAHLQMEAFVPSLGGALLPPDSEVDFDDYRIAFNGPLPEGSSPSRVLGRALTDAGVQLTEGYHGIEGDFDREAVAARLGLGIAATEAAEDAIAAQAPGLPDPEAAKYSAKRARAAVKAAKKAKTLVEKGKPLSACAPAAWKAVLALGEATQMIDPHTLPGK